MEAAKNTPSDQIDAKIEPEKLNEWMLGDQNATKMLLVLFEGSQIADDICDGDTENPHEAMARMLSLLFVELLSNPFWDRFRFQFIPVIATSIQIWSCSDEWGKSDDEIQRIFGFVWREVLEQVVILAILMPIVASMGGIAGSQTLTLMIRGMALGRVQDSNARMLLAKEVAVGLLNGLMRCAL